MEQKSLTAKENCLDVEENFLDVDVPAPRGEGADANSGSRVATDVARSPAFLFSYNS